MRLHHLALKSTDPARLAAWYEALLGLRRLREQVDAQGIRSVWIDLDGTIFMIERADLVDEARVETRATGWHGVYVAVDPGSGLVWEARVRAMGATPSHHTASTLYVADPEGNRFGLSCWPAALYP